VERASKLGEATMSIKALKKQFPRGFRLGEYMSEYYGGDGEGAMRALERWQDSGMVVRGLGDWYSYGMSAKAVNSRSGLDADSIGNIDMLPCVQDGRWGEVARYSNLGFRWSVFK
jgi:hypothetical protein